MNLDRIYRIIRIYFGLLFLYPVHPVDPVRKWTAYCVKFLFRLDRPFFWLAAGLTPETRHLKPDFKIQVIRNE